MKPIVQEWITKAEGDFVSAQRELQAPELPNYDSACFHSQQCIEKYLKACLQAANVPFSKTHDLTVLLDLLLPIEPNWEHLRPSLDALTAYAVEFRYPGASADFEIADQAVQDCTKIREILRQHLNL